MLKTDFLSRFLQKFRRKVGRGFTLVEVMIYVFIFAVIGGLLSTILLHALRVEERESAHAALTSQLNFALQTIQRLIRESSYIDLAPGLTTSTLKLMTVATATDPLYIFLSGGAIIVQEGNKATTSLTNNDIVVTNLSFQKISQPFSHDIVLVDIAANSLRQTPIGQVKKTLSSAIARVSAATFDSDLLPGSSTRNIGQNGTRWRDLFVSGLVYFGRLNSDPTAATSGAMYYNIANNIFRVYNGNIWADLSSYWNSQGNNIYSNNTGNIGIGTTTPIAKLDVASTTYLRGAPGGLGLFVNSGGAVLIGTTTLLQSSTKLKIAGGHLAILGSGGVQSGIVLRSPNNTCFLLLINNSGGLTTSTTSCP
jgi:type II secretory pathway pseudopilin PulG